VKENTEFKTKWVDCAQYPGMEGSLERKVRKQTTSLKVIPEVCVGPTPLPVKQPSYRSINDKLY